MGSISKDNQRTAITINREFYELCKKIAQQENRSFNSLCIYALKKYVEENHSNLK